MSESAEKGTAIRALHSFGGHCSHLSASSFFMLRKEAFTEGMIL